MQKHTIRDPYVAWALLLLLASVWGSSYILMKKGLKVFSVQEVGAMRIVFTATFFLPLALLQLKSLRFHDYKRLFFVGLSGSLLPTFLFVKAQSQLDSTLNGALNALTPIFTLLVGNIFFKQPIFKKEILGALLGIVGTLLLIFAGAVQHIGGVNYYVILPLLGCFCYGLNSNMIKHYVTDLNPNTITSVSFLPIGVIMAIFLFTQTAFVTKLQTAEGARTAMGCVLALSILSSGIAYLIFTTLVKGTSPVFASTVSFFTPIVALLWGIWDGEALLGTHYLGMGTILLGVYWVNKPRPLSKP